MRSVSGAGWTHSRWSRPGPGRALAEPVHQHPEAGERLLAGHLLLDDRRHQGLHHQAAAAQPGVRVAAPDLREHRVSRLEAGPVVAGARAGRAPLQRPFRARPPGLGVDLAGGRSALDSQCRRALGGADAAPVPAVRVDPEGRIAAAVALLVEQRCPPGRASPAARPASGRRCSPRRVGGRPT